MEKLVITYDVGDECTFSAEINICIEYESAEALFCDLEYYLKNEFEKSRKPIQIEQLKKTYENSDFFDQLDLSSSDFFDSAGKFYPPTIQTLDEWFASRKIN